jgi:hypothetical protein
MTIWKYTLNVVDEQTITMQAGAKILSVANQSGVICMWAIVDPSQLTSKRTFEVIPTGGPMPDKGTREFLGTIQIDWLVLHIFERTN